MIRSAARLLILAALLWAAPGCLANRPTLTCPAKGGPAWRELATPHFVVKTDLPEDDARQVTLELETARAALVAVLGAPADEAASRMQLIVFERRRDIAALSGIRWASGYFAPYVPGDAEHRPAIVFHGGLDYHMRRVLQHELVHHLLRRRTSHLPWWLDEGLAETYSTLRVEGDVALIGEAPRDVDFWAAEYSVNDGRSRIPQRLLPASRAPSAGALARAVRSSVEASGEQNLYYAAAWKMIHVLRGHTDPRRAPKFNAMLRLLMNGTPGSQAFAEAYGHATLEDFSAEYQEFFLDRREFPEERKIHLPAAPRPSVTPMSDAAVHALWATLIWTDPSVTTSPEEEIARGLAESPGDLSLIYARASNLAARGRWRDAQSDVWDLLRADRGDARYLYLDLFGAYLALAQEKDPAAAVIRLRRMSSIVDRLLPVAETPWQRILTALTLVELKRHDEAAALVERALTAEPSCGECFAIRAMLLAENGKVAAAQDALEQAETLIPRWSPFIGLTGLRQRIDKALKAHAPP